MGDAMVRRLLRHGLDVTVFNRTREKAEPLMALGAKVVDAPVELGDRKIVFVTLAGPSDLRQVMTGPRGLLTGGSTPDVVVDCTTVSADVSEELRADMAERGTALLAAPVSGNPRVAAAGRLTMAVSGSQAAYERARDYLALLGAGAIYVGEGELARLVKLCHNLFLGVVIQSMVEITVLAEKGGVPRATFLEYLNKSVMGSLFTAYKTPGLVNLDFTATFTSTLLRKDYDLGLASARSLGVPMPVASAVYQLVQRLVNEGHGDDDFATLLLLQARASALELVADPRAVDDGIGIEGPATLPSERAS